MELCKLFDIACKELHIVCFILKAIIILLAEKMYTSDSCNRRTYRNSWFYHTGNLEIPFMSCWVFFFNFSKLEYNNSVLQHFI